MKHKKLKSFFSNILTLIVVLSMLLTVGCTKKESKELVVGAILPLTGPAAQFGQYAKEGIEIGLQEIKSSNPNIRVIYEDSQGDPKNAVSILNKFIKVDKVKAVFVVTSGETLAILPIINQEKILTFTGTILPGITAKSPYLLRNASSLDIETKYMADYLANKKNKPTVATIYVNNDAGVISNKEFQKTYASLSGKVVAAETYELGASDFGTQLAKIKSANPDYLYILTYKEFGLIMKQARELGMKSAFIGTTTFDDPSGVKAAGNAADGATFTITDYDPNASTPDLVQFQKLYQDKYGRKADLYAAMFRDNVHILAQASKASPANATEFKKAILNIGTFNGVSGKTKFLENGDVEKPLKLKTIRDGKFLFLEEGK